MRNALVTGGSRGIGKAISEKLAMDGFHVLINYSSDKEKASETKQRIQDLNGSCELIRFDVSDASQVENSLAGWAEKNRDSYIEVLVNNAGVTRDQLMLWMKKEDWSTVIDINLNGFFFVSRIVLKDMLARKRGRIINIASLSGQKGQPGQVNYSATKAGLIGATKALAQEVGKRNVTVNAVAPGFILTEMTEQMSKKEMEKFIPLKRFGKPEEVAEVVSFLASNKSSYITGEVISVNGGLYT